MQTKTTSQLGMNRNGKHWIIKAEKKNYIENILD